MEQLHTKTIWIMLLLLMKNYSKQMFLKPFELIVE